MLTLLLSAIVFFLTRQILRGDELVPNTDLPEISPDADLEDLTDGFYTEVSLLISEMDFADFDEFDADLEDLTDGFYTEVSLLIP